MVLTSVPVLLPYALCLCIFSHLLPCCFTMLRERIHFRDIIIIIQKNTLAYYLTSWSYDISGLNGIEN